MNLLQRIKTSWDILTKGTAVSSTWRPYNATPGYYDKQPVYKDWNERNAIKEGYKANEWVYACIRKLSSQASSVPWTVFQKQHGSDKKWVEVEGHPLAVLLKHPNMFMSGQDLIESLVVYLNLTGNAPWWMVPVKGMPSEIWPLIPTQVRPVPSKQNYLDHYEYEVDGTVLELDTKLITHFKFFNPDNLYWGLAPLQAAARIVDTLNEQTDWNKVSMQNRAIADVVFSWKGDPDELNEDNYLYAKKMIKEQYEGSKNARTPFVMGNFVPTVINQTPVEMDFINSIKLNREAVCGVFGVPPVLVGIQDKSTYNNYETAKLAFWEDTIIPFLDDVKQTINLCLTPYWGDDLECRYDVSGVPVLQKQFFTKVDAAQKLWTMGVPFNQINEKLQMGMDPIPGGDVGWVSGALLPAGSGNTPEDMNPTTEQVPGGDNTPATQEPIASKGKKKVVYGDSDAKLYQELKNRPVPTELKAFELKTDDERTTYWKDFEKERTTWYGPVTKQVQDRINDECKAVIDAVNNVKDRDKIIKVVSDTLKNQRPEWLKLYQGIYTAVMGDFGNKIARGLKKSGYAEYETKGVEFVYDPWKESTQQWIQDLAGSRIVSIEKTTLDFLLPSIRDVLSDSIDGGWGIPEIAKRVRNVVETQYQGFGRYRSERIARTEVCTASNAGAVDMAKTTGLELTKSWLATKDSRVRPEHLMADGQTVDIDDDFNVGGERLPHPGGGSLPKNNINCRCTCTFDRK